MWHQAGLKDRVPRWDEPYLEISRSPDDCIFDPHAAFSEQHDKWTPIKHRCCSRASFSGHWDAIVPTLQDLSGAVGGRPLGHAIPAEDVHASAGFMYATEGLIVRLRPAMIAMKVGPGHLRRRYQIRREKPVGEYLVSSWDDGRICECVFGGCD